jgi:hypothetical protein
MSRRGGLARVPTVTTCIAMSEARASSIFIDAFCLSKADHKRQRGKGSMNHREIFLQASEGDDCRRPLMLSFRFSVFSIFVHVCTKNPNAPNADMFTLLVNLKLQNVFKPSH